MIFTKWDLTAYYEIFKYSVLAQSPAGIIMNISLGEQTAIIPPVAPNGDVCVVNSDEEADQIEMYEDAEIICDDKKTTSVTVDIMENKDQFEVMSDPGSVVTQCCEKITADDLIEQASILELLQAELKILDKIILEDTQDIPVTVDISDIEDDEIEAVCIPVHSEHVTEAAPEESIPVDMEQVVANVLSQVKDLSDQGKLIYDPLTESFIHVENEIVPDNVAITGECNLVEDPDIITTDAAEGTTVGTLLDKFISDIDKCTEETAETLKQILLADNDLYDHNIPVKKEEIQGTITDIPPPVEVHFEQERNDDDAIKTGTNRIRNRIGTGLGDEVTILGDDKPVQNVPLITVDTFDVVPDVFPVDIVKTQFTGFLNTSDILGAGTDAGVELWLTDTHGETVGPIQLREPNGNYDAAMERGQQDCIIIDLDTDIGDLYKIAVRQDGAKVNSDWHLASVELTRITTGISKPVIFNFNRWIQRCKIYESAADGSELIVYKVRIKCSSPAGTDGNLFINIRGNKGQTQERKLTSLVSTAWHDALQPGQVDTFEIRAVDLGCLQSVLLVNTCTVGWDVLFVEVEGPVGVSRFDNGQKPVTGVGLELFPRYKRYKSVSQVNIEDGDNVIEISPMEVLLDEQEGNELEIILIEKDVKALSEDAQISMTVDIINNQEDPTAVNSDIEKGTEENHINVQISYNFLNVIHCIIF